MSYIRKLREAKLVIVLYDFAFFGGATKPIFNYYKFSLNKGNKVELAVLNSFKGVIKFIIAACVSKQLVINGLAAMQSWLVLLICYFRRGIIFYVHEAEYSFRSFEKKSSIKYKFLRFIFPKLKVACVSEWQRKFLISNFTVKHSEVIYNNIDLDITKNLDKSRLNIVMLGYIMSRKGVNLFSKVADIAAINYPNLKFTWIGSGVTSGLYLSPNVDWIGEVLRPEFLLSQSDLLFLSSIDDPFPLACLEALALKKKCVVYTNTGTAEIIKSISGCSIYDIYSPESAMTSILMALNSELDLAKLEEVYKKYSSVASFAVRLDNLIRS